MRQHPKRSHFMTRSWKCCLSDTPSKSLLIIPTWTFLVQTSSITTTFV